MTGYVLLLCPALRRLQRLFKFFNDLINHNLWSDWALMR